MTTTQLKDPPISKRLAKNIKRNLVERVIEIILMFAALGATFITLGIVYILVTAAYSGEVSGTNFTSFTNLGAFAK